MQSESITSVALCAHCQQPIPPKGSYRGGSERKYCSKNCVTVAERVRRYGPDYQVIPSASRGAVSELLVCAHLLTRGYEVFRAQSAACSCDLIALRSGQMYRIEVRSATRNLNGQLTYPWRDQKDLGRSDVLATVEPNGTITYMPDMPV